MVINVANRGIIFHIRIYYIFLRICASEVETFVVITILLFIYFNRLEIACHKNVQIGFGPFRP
jgi:hypothetical protein